MSGKQMTGVKGSAGLLADYGMLYLPGRPGGAYTITSGANVFQQGGVITGNSSSVTLVNPLSANAAMQLANAGTYRVKIGVCVAVVPSNGYLFSLYINGNPADQFTIVGGIGATPTSNLPPNLMTDVTCILTLPASAQLSLVSVSGNTMPLNSLYGVGGPAAYITVVRVQ